MRVAILGNLRLGVSVRRSRIVWTAGEHFKDLWGRWLIRLEKDIAAYYQIGRLVTWTNRHGILAAVNCRDGVVVDDDGSVPYTPGCGCLRTLVRACYLNSRIHTHSLSLRCEHSRNSAGLQEPLSPIHPCPRLHNMASSEDRYALSPRARRRHSRSESIEDAELRHRTKRRRSGSRSRSPARARHQDKAPRSRSQSRDRRRRRGGDRDSRSPFREGRAKERPRSRRSASRSNSRTGRNDRAVVKKERSMSRSRSRDRDRDRRRRHRREKSRSRSRDRDRERDHHQRRHHHRKDRSQSRDRRRPSHSRSPRRSKKSSPSPSPIRRRGPLPSQNDSFQNTNTNANTTSPPPDKQKPNFSTTGILAREANRVEGTNISLKYHEPPESRKPPASTPWSLLIFKGTQHLGSTDLHTRSCWLVGRERKVCDLLAEHPSVSGQHAVIQFRWVLKKRKATEEEWEDGGKVKGKVKPYLIDLESANGTMLNGEVVEKSRYFELRSGDVVKFGQSEREYVVMLPPAGGS